MLSGYEDLLLPGSDKMTPCEIMTEHVVDIHRIEADFRDAFERNQASSSQTYGVNKHFSSQSPVQKRLSIYNWNRGPRRGKEDAIEKQITGKWHLITYKKLLTMSNTKSFMNDFT